MRTAQHKRTEILGYRVDRVESLALDGSVESRHYAIRRSADGVVVGEQPSLRAAKRWIVLCELGAFTRRQERDATTGRVA